ncbi:MAG: hypothetical protein J2P25_24605, partial [Nocardiopsaceae bacterium]|nr:hypothetical protein [Nocardiopsaceae bacterium]
AGTARGAALAPTAAPGDRTETPVASSSPITSVAESVVRVKIPLPASVGPHPAACDWLSYLRYRDVHGPTQSAKADRILVAQPGIFEGAGAFDSVARDTVAQAAAHGKYIEFWALDRRSNCLEDHTGTAAALAARNPRVAIGYYYHHKRIDGHAFRGFLNSGQLGWLAHVGIAQTVTDEYRLLAEELPSQALRKQKVLCGGHSLGGTITAFFAEWDFGGHPGYQQCAGYFALDSTISTSLGSLSGLPTGPAVHDAGLGYTATAAGLDSGAIPRDLNLPVLINAETENMLDIYGVAADVAPSARNTVTSELPRDDANIDATERLLFSRNAVNFATGYPSIRDFRFTNDAALGALLDSNSQPLAMLEVADGFFNGHGGAVADKDFPLPSDLARQPALQSLDGSLLGTDPLAIPATPRGPVYGWENYDQVGTPGNPLYYSRDGRPFTTASSEVTDIHEVARSFAEQPLDFTEWYFPTKLATDIYQKSEPQIADHLKYPNGITANPTINLLGGSGLVIRNGVPPNGKTVVAPHYHHLDVLTASPHQNDGHPELISENLARFALSP